MNRLKTRFLQENIRADLLLCALLVCGVATTSNAKFLSEKDAKKQPRIRVASMATPTTGVVFLDLEHLGKHSYRRSWSEKNGIVYTCRGGHIDISHLRKFADWTAFLATEILQHLQKNETKFSFKLWEPSRYLVELTYPDNWQELSSKEKAPIERSIAIAIGQYCAYSAGVWHEILTWFGFRSIGLYKEFQSSFSWEDIYSDLLGTHIGAEALRDSEHEFNEAMTLALERELEKLNVQPKRVAIQASEKVKGLWYSGSFIFVKIKGRNLDIGLSDGFVTPWLIPSVNECEAAEAQPYPVPNLDALSKYGFSMRLEIEPKEWEKSKILKIVYPNDKERKRHIEPVVHFAPIMDYIRQEAIREYDFRVAPSAAIMEP